MSNIYYSKIFCFLSFSQKRKKQYSCTKEKRIHKKFPISECPAIFHSCVVVFLPLFGSPMVVYVGGCWSQFESGNKRPLEKGNG